MVRLLGDPESNIRKITPVDFNDNTLEYLEIMVEPEAFINVAAHLINQAIIPFFSLLKNDRFYDVPNGRIYDFLESEEIKKQISEAKGIGIMYPSTHGKSAALIRENKVIAFCTGSDYDYFHSFNTVQPKVLNDSLVDFIEGKAVIPTKLGNKFFKYSLEGHHRTIERKPVKSIREPNIGTQLEMTLSSYNLQL